MITFISKVPQRTFNRNCRYSLNRINCTARHYANYPAPRKDASTGTAYTLGAITLIGAATIGYAKYDPKFREWMGDNVPYADGFFKVIFQEDKPISMAISDLTDQLKSMITGGEKKRKSQGKLEDKEKDYTPPRPVFPSIVNKEEKEEKFSEIRVQKDSQINVVVEKPKPEVSPNSPKTIAELELKIAESATKAIKTYSSAETALKDYNRDIEIVVEDSVEKLDPTIWASLKNKTEKKNEMLKQAEDSAIQTMKDLEKLNCLLDDPIFEASEISKASAKRNINRLRQDIRAARESYEKVRKSADITEKYWKKVEAARCHFIEELEILFPDFDINRKKLTLKPSDLDLFVVYVFANLMFYSKELHKLETIGQMKLKQALESARRKDPDASLSDTAIQEAVEIEKRKLTEEFEKKCLAMRKEREQELRHRLKCQEQAHLDHLTDVLATREQELEREFARRLDEQLAGEQGRYKLQMAGMIARMKGMRCAIIERVETDKIAHQSQVLWSACQALHRAVKTSTPGVPWHEQMRPLHCEIEAIKKAASEGDELVGTILAGIPTEATSRGVYPEGALRERFLKVERVARRLALVPADGARLPLYILSYIQSMLLVNSVNPIPQAELEDKVVDFNKLNTYDILQRARYWLDRGNYAQTLKYMNLLKGASRCIANDWIQETRILLETQQAAETLMAHAVAGGLQHL